ncbi:MAG: hypothetical protein IPK17_00470 [Chloroflexi bacterium]|uniref:hypothetical protein n=1 Tax=Candidatus Flexifilum breve TaxID=3140694 RepID=UPI003135627A|nr:hypothetical protein [Chloroflexota bacterium]
MTGQIDGKGIVPEVTYDAVSETLLITGIVLTPTDRLVVRLYGDEDGLLSRRDRKRETVLKNAAGVRFAPPGCATVWPNRRRDGR